MRDLYCVGGSLMWKDGVTEHNPVSGFLVKVLYGRCIPCAYNLYCGCVDV